MEKKNIEVPYFHCILMWIAFIWRNKSRFILINFNYKSISESQVVQEKFYSLIYYKNKKKKSNIVNYLNLYISKSIFI